MLEAIYSRVKFAFLLGVFFLPILITMWSKSLEGQIEQARYLPPPAMLAGWQDRPTDSTDPDSEAIADTSDGLGLEMP